MEIKVYRGEPNRSCHVLVSAQTNISNNYSAFVFYYNKKNRQYYCLDKKIPKQYIKGFKYIDSAEERLFKKKMLSLYNSTNKLNPLIKQIILPRGYFLMKLL